MSIHESVSSENLNNNLSTSSHDRTERDKNSAPTMSMAASSSSLIEDDHIEEIDTVNIGNLIIRLETDIEQNDSEQACSKPSTSSTLENDTRLELSPTQSSRNATLLTKQNHKSNRHSNSNNNNNSNFSQSHSRNFSKRDASSSERGEHKSRVTRESKSTKSEHKVVSSTNNGSRAATTTMNNNSNYAINFESNSPVATNDVDQSISSTKECGTSTSIGTITEPDCLGPCEPGTSVTLEGIVWQETEGGILVVNVTWRGKTYVGALLDCTKHDWAPPRLCDSPASDIDVKTHKGVRSKRIMTRSNGIGVGVDEKNLLQTTGKLRNGKGRRILNSNEMLSCSKKQRDSSQSSDVVNETGSQEDASVSNIGENNPINIDTTAISANCSTTTTSINLNGSEKPTSPTLLTCTEPDCSKKYRNVSGLLYHQSFAHNSDGETSSANPLENKPPSPKENIKSNSEDEVSEKNVVKMETSDQRTPLDVKAEQPIEHSKMTSVSSKSMSSQNNIKLAKSSTSSERQNLRPLPNQDRSFSTSHKSLNHEVSKDNPNIPVIDSVPIMPPQPKQSLSKNKNSDQNPNGCGNMTDQMHNPILTHKASTSGLKSTSLPPPPPHPPMQQAPNNPPPISFEEGMKPSGTSTGPPPAPHPANYYFSAPFSYGNPLSAYNAFDQLQVANRAKPPNMNPSNFDPAVFARFMSMNPDFLGALPPLGPPMPGGPLPPDPTRLINPSIYNGLPFARPGHPPLPPNPILPPVSNSQMNLPMPMMPLPSSPIQSPRHLRLPNQAGPPSSWPRLP